MTGADSTKILAEHDPKYLRNRRRERWGIVGIAILSVAALIGAGFAIAGVVRTEKRVTTFEKSSCAQAQADPSDKKALRECQLIRAAAERTANENVNCIPFLRAGYVCPKPGSPLAEERRAREIREAVGGHHGTPGPIASVQPNGGDASTPSTGHSPSEPSPGGSTDSPSHPHAPSVPHQSGGGGEPGEGHESTPPPAAPSPPTPSSPPGSSSSSTTERTTETVVVEPAPAPEAPVTTAAGGLVESVGSTVEGLGETVGGTVEGVEATTCQLAKVLCHE